MTEKSTEILKIIGLIINMGLEFRLKNIDYFLNKKLFPWRNKEKWIDE